MDMNMNIQVNKTNTSKGNLVYKKTLRPYEKRALWLKRVFIWISILLVLYPVLWVVGASFAPGDAFFSGSIFPKSLTLQNYRDLFAGTDIDIKTSFMNSLILCTSVAFLQLIMTGTAAYAFSRMKFKGRRNGLMSLLILQMFPSIMTVTAVYTIMYKYNLMDNMLALILFLAGGSAFNVWLLKGFIDGIPRELDEAAKVDGANQWQIFWKIIIPLARPMLAVMFFFCFQGMYNEFIISSVALKDPAKKTVALALQSYIYGNFDKHWTKFAAASIIASIPLIILFMVLQKYIEKGLVAGAVKG